MGLTESWGFRTWREHDQVFEVLAILPDVVLARLKHKAACHHGLRKLPAVCSVQCAVQRVQHVLSQCIKATT